MLNVKQCFGSGSMWIRIEMAPLDPDPGQSKMVNKNHIIQVVKGIDHFEEDLMVFL